MQKTDLHHPSTQSRRVPRVAPRGFVLLEIVLAMALFSIVAVGMTRALDQIAQTSKAARMEAMVLRVLESVVAEVSHQPEFKKTSINFPKTADGVDASARIEKIELRTKDKVVLDHLFIVRADAWLADGRDQMFKRSMETYVYSPNSEW
ncbi:MAG: prepilin-type N-terminal cleavage/methylation domain-containing protein [Verrucomicrobiaceae bacterium]|nr:prepilin-type N-terminal cleavage/methylation domain-containing protein [Verrucomicrobiaceae bacterium]